MTEEKMRKLHLLVGILTTFAFFSAGAYMMWVANLHSLRPEHHLLFVSRHIYMLAPALINLVLATYVVQLAHPKVLRLQSAGTLFVVVASFFLVCAFVFEPIVVHERTKLSALGIFTLWAGTMLHVIAMPLGKYITSRKKPVEQNREAPPNMALKRDLRDATRPPAP